MSFYDWSPNPANNTLVGSINWSEGMLPGQVNDSARQMMADMASWLAQPTFPYSVTFGAGYKLDAQYYQQITNSGDTPVINFNPGAYYAYTRSTGQHAWYIGNIRQMYLDSAVLYVTNLSSAGSLVGAVVQTNKVTVVDANFRMDFVGGNPGVTFDSGDAIVFDRNANKYIFIIGGTQVASVDGGGNLRVTGQVYAQQSSV